MVRVFLLAVLAGLSVSCIKPHSCTEIGCANAAGVTLRTSSGEWAPGVYTLRITLDGAEHTCTFDMPADLPEGKGQSGQFSCDAGVEASFAPRSICMEKDDGSATSQWCEPIESQFDLFVYTQGTPAALALTLELDDTRLVEESHELAYKDYFPNGPDCDPACRQATVEIDVP